MVNVFYGCSLGLVAFGEDFCTSLQHNWLKLFLKDQFPFTPLLLNEHVFNLI